MLLLLFTIFPIIFMQNSTNTLVDLNEKIKKFYELQSNTNKLDKPIMHPDGDYILYVRNYSKNGKTTVEINGERIEVYSEILITFLFNKNNTVFIEGFEIANMEDVCFFKTDFADCFYILKKKDNNNSHYFSHDIIWIIGHRGMGETSFKSSDYKENTINSFNHLQNYNIDWAELDVHVTKDGIPVVIHDFSILIFDQRMPICEMTYLEFINVQKDFGNFDEYNNNVSLKSVLKNCPNMKFNVEIKYPIGFEFVDNNIVSIMSIYSYVDKVLQVVNEFKSEIFFSSFHPEVVFYLSLIQNKYPVYYLVEIYSFEKLQDQLVEALNMCCRYGFKGAVFDSSLISKYLENVCDMFKRKNKQVIIYGDSCNNEVNAGNAFEDGLAAIITDVPHLLDGMRRKLSKNL